LDAVDHLVRRSPGDDPAQDGCSALFIAKSIGIGSYQTAWRCCIVPVRHGWAGGERLRGDVEAYETFVGGPRWQAWSRRHELVPLRATFALLNIRPR